jgi:hypothetical protein
MPTWVLFFVPALAVVARGWMMLKFTMLTMQPMSTAELDRAGSRAIILPMAGFSFSALLALVVLETTRVASLRTPVQLLLASFLAFYSSLNLQSYKIRRWEDQLASGLKETGSGWLLLSVVAVVNSSPAGTGYKWGIGLVALGVWVVDLAVRLVLDYRYLRDLEAV